MCILKNGNSLKFASGKFYLYFLVFIQLSKNVSVYGHLESALCKEVSAVIKIFVNISLFFMNVSLVANEFQC